MTLGPEEMGFRIFKLQQPLQSGDSLRMDYDLVAEAKGFTDNNPKGEIAANGSCLVFSGSGGNAKYFPGLDYNKELMLKDRYDRKRQGLPGQSPLPIMEKADPAIPYCSNQLVTFHAEISTSGDQTVVSNGDLVKKWQEEGRNHFSYRSDIPIHDEFIFASGRYQVASDTHAGVAIEIYHDKKHPFNVGRMIRGIKAGLDFCTKAFSPYPYKVQRIVEIPDYMEEGGARSQPTVFIWRESAGFISNLDQPERADRVFGIAAHELGHQWWAYIVGPAYAEGIYLPTENICQYVWTMCLEREYGAAMSAQFRKQEMDDYLKRRKRDTKGERPLMRSLEGQAYLGYQKGGLALYALQDYLGLDKVNAALGAVVQRYGFHNDRYVTARDVVDAFKAAAPDSLRYLVSDLFERITLYENRANNAQAKRLDNGKYQVDLSVTCRKFYADSIGNQAPAALNDYVDIGVLGAGDSLLYLRKHRFTGRDSTITVVVDAKPARAGIDPRHILIDRDRDDNLTSVTMK
jgi:aminopeptidase N